MKLENVKSTPSFVILNKYLLWLLTIQMATALAYYGYVPLISLMVEEFSLNNTEIGWMTSAVFLGSSIIAIPSGLITDQFGARKSLFSFCLLLVFVIFSFSLSNSFIFILVLLFLLGMGYGGITPGTNKSIMENFDLHNRGTAMGLKQMGVSLGSSIGSLLLPLIANQWGWRVSLLSIAVLLVLVCIFHFKVLDQKEDYRRHTKVFNNIKDILKNKKLLKIIAIITFFIWVQLSVMTYLVLYLHESIHYSLSFSLFCLALLQIGGALGRAVWGVISDRYFNRNRGVIIALIGMFSGVLVIFLGTLSNELPEVFIGFLSLTLGITTQGWNGMFVLMISEVVKKEQIGLASGVGLATVYAGAIFGTPISGWIIDMSGNFEVMWMICGATIFIIGGLTIFLKLDA
ncbi:MFS transporter [Neobacillus terrae]|uniref:MFS transporter n=1 Tax=Neobacillus terrae TaxID=3034837 RepID=UPI00140C5354|nr:MFS transporter [Neobacillus terrae]NHM32470.1 MFS transporter [Neobacillus terrae]